MTTDGYGETNIELPAPEWITNDIANMIRNAKPTLPHDFVLQTIEKEHGLILYVDRKMFDRYTVEEKIIIAQRMNQLKDEIERTGCPAWIDIY